MLGPEGRTPKGEEMTGLDLGLEYLRPVPHDTYQPEEIRVYFDCSACGLPVRANRTDLIAEHKESCSGRPPKSDLTARELDVLQALAADGQTNMAIAKELGIAEETVKTHVRRLLDKLDVQSRAGAVARGFRLGILA